MIEQWHSDSLQDDCKFRDGKLGEMINFICENMQDSQDSDEYENLEKDRANGCEEKYKEPVSKPK